MTKSVADAELIKNVGVIDRDVGDHEVGCDEQPEHVFADVALADELARRAAVDREAVLDAEPLERRPDEDRLDMVEVDAFLGPERPDEEGAHHITRNGPKSSIEIWLATDWPTRFKSSM